MQNMPQCHIANEIGRGAGKPLLHLEGHKELVKPSADWTTDLRAPQYCISQLYVILNLLSIPTPCMCLAFHCYLEAKWKLEE